MKAKTECPARYVLEALCTGHTAAYYPRVFNVAGADVIELRLRYRVFYVGRSVSAREAHATDSAYVLP